MELSCGHVFSHFEIKNWVEKQGNCPTCRVTSQLKDFQYSYKTNIKILFFVGEIFRQLNQFEVPKGIDIIDARRRLEPIVKDINDFHKAVYKNSVSYINKHYPDNFDSMNDQLLEWKDKVDIR